MWPCDNCFSSRRARKRWPIIIGCSSRSGDEPGGQKHNSGSGACRAPLKKRKGGYIQPPLVVSQIPKGSERERERSLLASLSDPWSHRTAPLGLLEGCGNRRLELL